MKNVTLTGTLILALSLAGPAALASDSADKQTFFTCDVLETSYQGKSSQYLLGRGDRVQIRTTTEMGNYAQMEIWDGNGKNVNTELVFHKRPSQITRLNDLSERTKIAESLLELTYINSGSVLPASGNYYQKNGGVDTNITFYIGSALAHEETGVKSEQIVAVESAWSKRGTIRQTSTITLNCHKYQK